MRILVRCLVLISAQILAVLSVSNDMVPRGIVYLNETDLEEKMRENAANMQDYIVNGSQYNGQCNIDLTKKMPVCYQYCDEWCWATVTTMTVDYYKGWKTCNANECKLASREFNEACCPVSKSCKNTFNDTSSACNRGGLISQMADGAEFLSGKTFTSAGSLSQAKLDKTLASGTPVMITVHWVPEGGHALLIGGCAKGKYYLHDPWPWYKQMKAKQPPAWQHLSYDQLLEYPSPTGKGKWSHSVFQGGPLADAVIV